MAAEVIGITSTLDFFAQAFDRGRMALLGDAQSIFRLLIIIEIIFAGVYTIIGGSADLRAVARKILIIGFFSYVITNYTVVLQTVLDGFIFAGQKATGVSGANLDLIRNPGQIFVLGCEKVKPAFDKLAQYGMLDYLSLDPIVLLICGLISCLSFGLIAIQVFVTYLEYLLVSALGFILIPFGIFKPLGFLADRVFGAIIGFGIKFMTLSLIIGVSEQFIANLVLPDTVSWQQALDFAVISLALMFLTFHAPSVALSLLTGSPHISAGTVAATAAGASLGTSRLAQASASGATSLGRGAVITTGALQGGAAVAAASLKGSASGGISMNAGRMISNAATGAVMGASAPIAAGLSTVAERVVHGKSGSPTGSRATRIDLGLNPNEGGIKGALNRGKFAVPAYRAMARENKNAAPGSNGEKSQSGEGKSETQPKENKVENQNNGVAP